MNCELHPMKQLFFFEGGQEWEHRIQNMILNPSSCPKFIYSRYKSTGSQQ